MNEKILFIVFDGLGDKPCKKFNYKTPLEVASKPNIDYISRKSRLGLHIPYKLGIPIGSGLAHLRLFGYSLKDYVERGVLEALGLGINLKENQLAFRVNFCTVNKNFIVLDRRAGRSGLYLEEFVELLNREFEKNPFGVNIRLYKGKDYRGVLIIESDKKLEPIKGNDPQKEGRKIIFSDKNLTWRIVSWITKKSFEVLDNHPLNKKREEKEIPKANCIILRGGGFIKKVKNFYEKYKLEALGIADTPLYLGVAKYLGFDITYKKDEEKIKYALKNLEKYDFIFIHFKKTDSYGEDGNFEKKKEYIEYIDQFFEDLRDFEDVIVVTGDHNTPCCLKRHSGDYVPLLIYNPNYLGDDLDFNEKNCRKGSLGVIKSIDIMRILLDETGRAKIFKK